MKLLIVLSYLLSISVYAGIGSFYFDKSGISCTKNGVRLAEGLIGSNQNLIQCYSDLSISNDEISQLEKDTDDLRLHLESWVYIQNASERIIENTSYRLNEFQKIKQDLDSNIKNDQVQSWRETYTLLSILYDQKKENEYNGNLCSNWRFWNYAERLYKGNPCEHVKSDAFQQEKAANLAAIKKLEDAHPVFHHPIFQGNLSKDLDERKPFKSLVNNFISSSIPDLQEKKSKFKKISKLPLTKENLDKVLDDPVTLREITAVDYDPESKIYKSSDGYKSVSLHVAKCHISQTLIAHEIDDLLQDFGKDVALVISPFAIKGKISAIMKSAKATQNMMRLKQARTTFVAAEGLYITVEAGKLNEAENKCDQISKEVSQHSKIPPSLANKAKECQELMKSMATSYALAVIGGAAATKLSKYDITDIRIARIAAQGKQKLFEASGAVKATLIKQSDIILQQLESLSDSMSPQPAMAMANGSQATGREVNSINQYNQNASSSQGGSKRKKNKKNKKNSKENSEAEKAKIADINARVDRAVQKLDCFVDKSCKTEMIMLLPGLKSLANGPKGLHLTEQTMDLFKGTGFKNLNPDHYAMIKSCLKVKNKQLSCNSKQYEAAITLIDYHFKSAPHPHFYTQVMRSLGFDASDGNVSRSTTFLAQTNPNKLGKIKGNLHDIKTSGESIYVDGKLIESKDLVYAYSLLKENKAIKALSKLGFNVQVIPEEESLRQAQGIQQDFSRLTRDEKIAKGKNPDVILQGDYIADIYSPLKGINNDSIPHVVEGILFKSEGRNFRRTLTHQTVPIYDDNGNHLRDLINYGKRQTNRVVIYVDEINGDSKALAQEIRNQIGDKEPEHLQEAFLVIENNGTTEMLPVWP